MQYFRAAADYKYQETLKNEKNLSRFKNLTYVRLVVPTCSMNKIDREEVYNFEKRITYITSKQLRQTQYYLMVGCTFTVLGM